MSTPNSAYLVETSPSTHLKWSTFVTPSIPVVTTDFAPGEHERPWPPISSTLIYGLRDAVLVDSFITLEQARAQADWIASTGKNLTTIYATHGHGDHFFGATILLKRFPKARFVAAPSAIQVMKEQSSPEFVAKFWESRFPHQLPKHLVVAEELRTNLFELEGERLVVIPLGFTAIRERTQAEWDDFVQRHPEYRMDNIIKGPLVNLFTVGALAAVGTPGGDSTGTPEEDAAIDAGAAGAEAGIARTMVNEVPQPNPNGEIIVAPNGNAVKIPAGYVAEPADNANGIVYRPAGSTGNANIIRVSGPDAKNPTGYFRIYNSEGQPIIPSTGKPGSEAQTHIPQ